MYWHVSDASTSPSLKSRLLLLEPLAEEAPPGKVAAAAPYDRVHCSLHADVSLITGHWGSGDGHGKFVGVLEK